MNKQNDAFSVVREELNASITNESNKGLAHWFEAIWGKWPGDETDEEIEKALMALEQGIPLDPKDARERLLARLASLVETSPCVCDQGRQKECVRCVLSDTINFLTAIGDLSQVDTCPACGGTGEDHMSTSISGDDGWRPCGICGGSKKRPTDAEIRELREQLNVAHEDLQVLQGELEMYQDFCTTT